MTSEFSSFVPRYGRTTVKVEEYSKKHLALRPPLNYGYTVEENPRPNEKLTVYWHSITHKATFSRLLAKAFPNWHIASALASNTLVIKLVPVAMFVTKPRLTSAIEEIWLIWAGLMGHNRRIILRGMGWLDGGHAIHGCWPCSEIDLTRSPPTRKEEGDARSNGEFSASQTNDELLLNTEPRQNWYKL